MRMGEHGHRERKGVRPSETSAKRDLRQTSGESKASDTANACASGGRLRHHRSPPQGASSSKDEMMIGGLCGIDGIDVVATLIPEEDAWQFNAAKTSTTDSQLLNRDQDTIAEWTATTQRRLRPEKPSTRERVRSSTQQRYGRDEPKRVRELDEFEVIMEVGEPELRATSGKKIWSKWVETRIDPASPAVRCRLCHH